jgi:phosphopantothenoylcysteine decarboxylase/phosphopantothenate--cysteine ligase
MDLDMYKHPSTRQSLEQLATYGATIIPAESGELASGLVGEGRMAEPETIVSFMEAHISKSLPLFGKKELITAGPTYEAIDPLRYIGNHSSGKMGFEIAKQAARLGAEVVLISGPSAQKCDGLPINRIDVTCAEEMYNAVFEHYDTVDIAIAAAAVADYKPSVVASQKIKKKAGDFVIKLSRTKDILSEMGKLKQNQFLVGFALETENEEENAIGKLERKNLDAIVLNSLQDKGAGFKANTNKITVIDRQHNLTHFSLKSKQEVAVDIFNHIIQKVDA